MWFKLLTFSTWHDSHVHFCACILLLFAEKYVQENRFAIKLFVLASHVRMSSLVEVQEQWRDNL